MLISESLRSGYSAEVLVAYRFLEAGRIPAWPMVPCRYDLVVDGGDQCYRVQVRRASPRIEKGETRRQFHCHLTKDRKTPLPVSSFDYLCVVAEQNQIYVIPVGALHCTHAPTQLITRLQITENGTRFAHFLNQFGIGTGVVPVAPTPLTPLKRSFWYVQPSGSRRKPHRRLSTVDAQAIRQLNIALTRDEEGPERVPVAQVAAQFGVHVATIRNLVRGLRKDL